MSHACATNLETAFATEAHAMANPYCEFCLVCEVEVRDQGSLASELTTWEHPRRLPIYRKP